MASGALNRVEYLTFSNRTVSETAALGILVMIVALSLRQEGRQKGLNNCQLDSLDCFLWNKKFH